MRANVSWIPNLLVLISLAGLGVWGHRNHWRFSEVHPQVREAHAGERASRTVRHQGSFSPDSPDASPTDCRRIIFESADSIQKSGIEFGTAVERSLNEYISANGVVSYDQTRLAQISSRIPATVCRAEKQVGQVVAKGEVLAVLDAVEVGKAKSEFMQAFVESTIKAATLKRLRAAEKVVAEQKVRDAEAAYREACLRRFQSRQALLNLGLPVRIGDDESLTDIELARQLQFLGLPQSLADHFDPETTTANLIPLVAPFDGVVIGRESVIGEVVQPSQSQFVIADVSRMWIRLDIRKEDAHRIAIGQQVQFVCDGTTHEFTAALSWIGTEVDEKTRTIPARVELDNPFGPDGQGERLLRAHAYGTGRICVGHRAHAVLIPKEALQRDGQSHLVFVPEPDGRSFQVCPVEPGITDGGWLEIRGGIAPGQTLVTTGSHLLKSEIERRRFQQLAE